ncbi:MAG: hypothetical protein DIU80_015980 [Chloroflexota bacterium]
MSISRACAALLLLLLGACGTLAATPAALTPSPSAIPPITPATPVETASATPAGPPTETPTSAPAAAAPCGYSWAYQEAPGVPERAQQALEAAGLSPTSVSARVFGENCVNPNGSVREFLAMSTTVEAELPVADLGDLATLGELTAQATGALAGIGDTPGGELEARLFFTSGEERRALSFSVRIAQQHIDAGNTGAQLLALLGYQP